MFAAKKIVPQIGGLSSTICGLFLLLLGKTPPGVLPITTGLSDGVVRRSSSFVVHHKVSGSYISRTVWFDLESPNFMSTSLPTYSTSTPDTTVLTTASRKALRKKRSKEPPTMASRGFSREQFKRINKLYAHRFLESLDSFGLLQNAIKYCTN